MVTILCFVFKLISHLLGDVVNVILVECLATLCIVFLVVTSSGILGNVYEGTVCLVAVVGARSHLVTKVLVNHRSTLSV